MKIFYSEEKTQRVPFPSGGDVAFTVAAARNRPRDTRTAVPLGRHSEVFWKLSKVVSRGRRNSFVTLPEHFLNFSWRAQKNTLDGLR